MTAHEIRQITDAVGELTLQVRRVATALERGVAHRSVEREGPGILDALRSCKRCGFSLVVVMRGSSTAKCPVCGEEVNTHVEGSGSAAGGPPAQNL